MYSSQEASESPSDRPVASKSPISESPSPRALRILAVDDEEIILNLYKNILQPNPIAALESDEMDDLAHRLFGSQTRKHTQPVFEITCCHQAEEAVQTVQAAKEEGMPFAVAFMDVRMPPGPDGVWAAENIRAIDPDINIVMVTAYSDLDPREISERVPPQDKLLYIQKPFHLQEIRQFASALGAKWQTEKMVQQAQANLEARVTERTAELARLNAQLRTEVEERKQTQNELEHSVSMLQATFEATADGILVVDKDGRTVSYNQKFLDLWGIPEEEAQTRETSILEYVSRQLKNPEVFKARVQALMAQPESESYDFLETRDGRTFERYSKAQWIGGQAVGRVWNFSDITKRAQAEMALRHSEDQLRQAQKMEALGKLAGGVAHDFNNHLTAIAGYTNLLLRDLSYDEKLKHRAEEIRKAADRAATLTRQLLAFSRRQVMQTRIVELNTIISDMDEMLRRLIGENISLRSKLDPEVGTTKADPGQIEQVLMNLVVNARDAMPNGGTITIETFNADRVPQLPCASDPIPSGPCVCLSVSDTGYGMDEETQARIFEPFFTTKEQGRGTGLGLATVYGIVQQSGGLITLESKQGEGTTFRVFLPRAMSASEIPMAIISDARIEGGSETLLLAEDEDAVRNLIAESLAALGYTILPARNGLEALEISKTHRGSISLLITDLVMPQMNGTELATELTDMRPSTRVLYMSGYTNDPFLQHECQTSHSMFLAKPFSMETLAKTIRAILDGNNYGQ